MQIKKGDIILVPPPLMATEPNERNPHLYCAHHQDHGCTTNECCHFRGLEEDLIQHGHWTKFVGPRPPPPPRNVPIPAPTPAVAERNNNVNLPRWLLECEYLSISLALWKGTEHPDVEPIMSATLRRPKIKPNLCKQAETLRSLIAGLVARFSLSFLLLIEGTSTRSSGKDNVIRTSFLSRRWRYLWASVPDLYFDGFVFSPKTKFVKFVDSVLLRRNGWGIHKFCLRFSDYYCDTSHACTWISTAVSYNVQELSVYYYPREHFALPVCLFELPICLFMCKSLRVLKLNLYESILNLPPSIHMPFLNTLHLISVTFSDNNLTRKLFSNCPVLKEVILEDCAVRDLSVFQISSLSIERLTIDGLPRDLVLCSGSYDHEIKISAPRLLSIKYINYKGQNICLEKPPSLVDAAIYLNTEWDESNQIYFHRVINFLRDLSNAKVLMVSSQRFQLLSVASNILGSFPKFFYLNHLKLAIAVTIDNIRLITCFLNNAPHLEFLTIDIVHLRWSNREEDSEPQNAPFACGVDHLKDIKITGFGGSKDELALVKFLLENVTVLERMTIMPSKLLLKNSELRMKISQEVQMYPSASTNIVVIFS
ncbi:hypothetical protein NE237_018630 [Protea cynaroides]|uniref:FBD domain-containing protein n=1 Tax=Protea cynaroides TaxID=273540 RepID=A0A9Q0KAG4_9MAGN|nr:hypothetical protein NE237_018630 [Protea cynaroides]